AWQEVLTKLGHTIEPLSPALVPLTSPAKWVRALQGISLKNVTLCAKMRGRVVMDELGEMLFTHTGVSGPLVLTLSSKLHRPDFSDLSVTVDLKPGLSRAMLEDRILREAAQAGAKMVKGALASLLPTRLLDAVLSVAGLDANKPIAQFTQAERKQLVNTLKALPIPVDGFASMQEAIITRGGVSVKEIDPSTMASRCVQGLYFAGEMIDIDAFTGGYNIQLALSTGFLAGSSC
ncbi:MAG: aminoacetone oxidase family FAD-binding enzyme, partial [Clostridia bacterium]|nr:aminoacetone oxidase family FAD-binding enzyme [Clostridia bacterium]